MEEVPRLKVIYLYITGLCNMRCKHCWVGAPQMYSEVPYEILKKALIDASELGCKYIKITGGEPFLRKRILHKLIELSYSLDMKLSIETNATLIEENDINILKRYGNVTDLGISLHFYDSKKFDSFVGLNGAFEKVVESMRRLDRNDIPFMCLTTVVKSNLHELSELTELVFENGADAVKFNPCLPLGKAREEIGEDFLSIGDYLALVKTAVRLDDIHPSKIFLAVPMALIAPYGSNKLQITRGTCNYKNLLSILPDGGVSLCGIGITHKETVIGNIKSESIKDMWMSGKGILSYLREQRPKGICNKCIFKSYCANQCPAYAYEAYKDFMGPNPICQEFYERGLFPEKYLE